MDLNQRYIHRIAPINRIDIFASKLDSKASDHGPKPLHVLENVTAYDEEENCWKGFLQSTRKSRLSPLRHIQNLPGTFCLRATEIVDRHGDVLEPDTLFERGAVAYTNPGTSVFEADFFVGGYCALSHVALVVAGGTTHVTPTHFEVWAGPTLETMDILLFAKLPHLVKQSELLFSMAGLSEQKFGPLAHRYQDGVRHPGQRTHRVVRIRLCLTGTIDPAERLQLGQVKLVGKPLLTSLTAKQDIESLAVAEQANAIISQLDVLSVSYPAVAEAEPIPFRNGDPGATHWHTATTTRVKPQRVNAAENFKEHVQLLCDKDGDGELVQSLQMLDALRLEYKRIQLGLTSRERDGVLTSMLIDPLLLDPNRFLVGARPRSRTDSVRATSPRKSGTANEGAKSPEPEPVPAIKLSDSEKRVLTQILILDPPSVQKFYIPSDDLTNACLARGPPQASGRPSLADFPQADIITTTPTHMSSFHSPSPKSLLFPSSAVSAAKPWRCADGEGMINLTIALPRLRDVHSVEFVGGIVPAANLEKGAKFSVTILTGTRLDYMVAAKEWALDLAPRDPFYKFVFTLPQTTSCQIVHVIIDFGKHSADCLNLRRCRVFGEVNAALQMVIPIAATARPVPVPDEAPRPLRISAVTDPAVSYQTVPNSRVKKQGCSIEIDLAKEASVECISIRVDAYREGVTNGARPQRLRVTWWSNHRLDSTILTVPLLQKASTMYFKLGRPRVVTGATVEILSAHSDGSYIHTFDGVRSLSLLAG